MEELEITLCCTLDNTVVTTRLSFTKPPKQIDDIKSSIQTAFYIPKCMQELLYNGAVLSGTEQLEKLYMRSGDSILVRYYTKLDVNDFEVISTWLRMIRDIVLSYEKDDPAHVLRRLRSINSSDSNQNCPHEDVADLIKADVNRSYIVQEGGIDLVLKLYRILTKIHWVELNRGSLDDLLGCLIIMWNISFNTYGGRLLIERSGSFDLVLKSLSHSSVLQKVDRATSQFADMVIGCISK